MKKIIAFILVVLCMLSMVACGAQDNDSNRDALGEMLNGKIIIGEKQYDAANIHSQLIADGWVADAPETSVLADKGEDSVRYYNEAYGTDLLGFHVTVFYYNVSGAEKNIYDCSVGTVMVQNADNAPVFGVKPDVMSNKTKDEVKNICTPDYEMGNALYYNGTESEQAYMLVVDFNDAGKVVEIALYVERFE